MQNYRFSIVRVLCLATLGLAFLAIPQSARAALELVAPAINTTPGGSGSFDLLITDTDPTGTPGYDLSAATLELAVGGSGVTFTGVDVNTVATYVFAGSADVAFSVPLNTTSLPATSFIASDFEIDSPFIDAINPGQTFGIADVSYTVSPTATLTNDALTFEDLGASTSLSDPNGNLIPFTPVSGSLNVTAATSAPLPSPLAAGLLLMAIGYAAMRISKNRALNQ